MYEVKVVKHSEREYIKGAQSDFQLFFTLIEILASQESVVFFS